MADFEEEFEKIYIRYFNDVFLFLKKLSKDESVAEEITSETFFKAMRSINNFRGEQMSVSGFARLQKTVIFPV